MDKKLKFSLVGSYQEADGYLGGANALRALGHEVSFIPSQLYKSENSSGHENLIIKDLLEQDPDIVLGWRFENLSPKQLVKVKNKINKPFILFSWDDAYSWSSDLDLRDKVKYIDLAFTCCMDSVKDYELNGCKKAIYCLPGFDPKIHYPDIDDSYACDVSIVCTNLYEDSFTKIHHMNRRTLLNAIINNCPDYNIKIYGSANFADIFPNNYAGWIPFEQSRKVFTNSKINLSTHIAPHGSMYINERVTQILGSGGLLMVDHVKDIHKVIEPWKDCTVMDWNPDKVAEQIKSMLENYSEYEQIKINGYNKAMETLTWGNWAQKIDSSIKQYILKEQDDV